MSYKTILAVVRVDQEERDLHQAIELCAEIDAHLSVLVVHLAPPPPIGDALAIGALWIDEDRKAREGAAEYVETIEAVLSQSGMSYDVEPLCLQTAGAGDALGERARYVDLTLIGADLANDPELKSSAVDGCLFTSARPVLIAPRDGQLSLRPKTVLLAWNSTLEAALAVRAALDLLVDATNVHVVLVDPDRRSNGEEPGGDIARYLARHGITVVVDRLPAMGRPVADVLQQHATGLSADLLVMGAYGHSRLRERIFGGVTRSLIDRSSVPVFMVH